jgi:predicted transcriptional regulator
MAETTTMTIRVPVEVRDKLDRLAELTKRSRSFLAGEALGAYVENELDIVEGVLEGLADFEAGRYHTHEEVMAHADAIIAEAYEREAEAARPARRKSTAR